MHRVWYDVRQRVDQWRYLDILGIRGFPIIVIYYWARTWQERTELLTTLASNQ